MDSMESRLREMAADRLLETVQFAKSKEEAMECGSSTALLLSMAQTLRACMRDWPNMEDNADAGVERAEALVDLKKALKEARRLTRSSALDSLAFVCSDALFLMAEQWPTARGEVRRKEEEMRSPMTATVRIEPPSPTFPPPGSRNGGGEGSSAAKKARLSMPQVSPRPQPVPQYFPSYPDEDEDQAAVDPNNKMLMMFNQNLGGLMKQEVADSGEVADIWSTQSPLAAFAAVTSSTTTPMQSAMRGDQSGASSSSRAPRQHRFNCPECGIGCVARSQLEAHMNVHTGDRPFGCEYCEKTYKRKDHLSDHIKKCHPAEYAAARQRKEAMRAQSMM